MQFHKQLQKDLSIPAITAGFVAVLVSYSGPLAIFFQAAQSADISSTMMTPEAIPHLKETQSIFLIGWMPNRGAPYLDFWRWFVCLVGPLYAPRTGPMGVHMGMFGCASLSLFFCACPDLVPIPTLWPAIRMA